MEELVMTKRKWEHLQPLRIPTGWTIMFHKLENLEPEEISPHDDIWLFSFTQDILYMYTIIKQKSYGQLYEQKLSIDLGWYPDGEPNGSFHLLALLNDNWEAPLLEFSSRSKKIIVEMIEQWIFEEFMPLHFINEAVFRKNHSHVSDIS